MRRERLTIDSTVVLDLLHDWRERHPLALQLLELQRAGEVELAVAASGHVFDAGDNAAERFRELEREGVIATVGLAYPGAFIPGVSAPGAGVDGFRASWDAVLATWKTHQGAPPSYTDALHVETHVLENRDVFVTDDRSLRAMCARLAAERSLPIVALSIAEYLDARPSTPH